MSLIRETKLNPVPIQTGYGVPTHISPAGSFYFDFNTGIEYQNKNGVSNWVEFFDAANTSLTGGTGVSVTGVTWSPNNLSLLQSNGSQIDTTISAFTAFNYADGNQQIGRVLTSDANGNATWQTPYLGTSLSYFFNNLSAGTSTYYQAKTDPQIGPLQTITNLNVVNNQLLAAFISDVNNPGITFIPHGIVELHIHAANTNSGKATELYFQFYKRTTGGTETLLGTSNITPTLGVVQSSYSTDLYLNDITLNITDRVVVKVYANVSGTGTAPNINLYTADNTLSRIEVPTPAVNISNYVPYTGATTDVNLGLYALIGTTISATTYQNLPIDVFVTGGTYDTGISTITFTNNTGGTFNVTGITATGGGGGAFTGGTVTGATNFTNGLTANTMSATTYQGLPVYQRLNDNDIINFFNYCGIALSGTSQGSPTWQISRINWSSATPTTAYAIGAWTGRTSLIYT